MTSARPSLAFPYAPPPTSGERENWYSSIDYFTVEHALSCAKGGFPCIRHNKIRDLMANLLTEVCNEVCIEPNLQPTTPDQLSGATANSQDEARLYISANGVWGGRFEKTFFDVRVFNLHAPSNRNQTPSACYRKHEREKKRAYAQRILEVEHSSFTPLVFFGHRRNGERGNLFLQTSGFNARSEVGLLIQHHTLLAEVPIDLLPYSLSHTIPARSKIFSTSCCPLPSSNRPRHY